MTTRIQIIFAIAIVLAIVIGYFLGGPEMFGLWGLTGEDISNG